MIPSNNRFAIRPWPRVLCWTLGALMILVGPAQAADDLGREMAEVAKEIKKSLDDRQQEAIAVGEFTGPARMASSGGPGIKHTLIEELKRISIRVERKADLEIKGDYFDAEDKETKLLSPGGAGATHRPGGERGQPDPAPDLQRRDHRLDPGHDGSAPARRR